MSNLVSIREISEPIVGGYWGEENEFPNSRVIRNGDITEDGKIRTSVPARKLSEKEILKSRVKIDDILITISGNVGRVALVKSETDEKYLPFVSSNFVKILRVNNTNFNPKFIFYFLRSKYFKQKLLKHVRGVAIQNLSTKIFDEKIVPVISPEEQNKFVLLVQEIEDLKNKREKANQKMTDLTNQLFNEKFANYLSDSKNYTRLGDEINFITSGARGWAKYYCNNGGSKYIRIQNIKSSKLLFDDIQYVKVTDSSESKRIKVATGDLLISITADLGRTAVVDEATAKEGAYINQHIALLRLSETFHPLFVSYFLESNLGKNQFLKYGQAAAKKGLNFDSIKSLKIPKTPIELQNKFAELVKEIEVQKEKQVQSTQMINELFDAVMAKSFA